MIVHFLPVLAIGIFIGIALASLVVGIALALHNRSIRKLKEQFEQVHSDEHFVTKVYPP